MARKQPAWVPQAAVEVIQAELIAEHGGLQGPARLPALEGALARPRRLWDYSATPPSVARLAACYGHALTKGHCFPDGNKRVALAVMDVFLQLNGKEILADEVDVVTVIESLPDGSLNETELAEWIATHLGSTKE